MHNMSIYVNESSVTQAGSSLGELSLSRECQYVYSPKTFNLEVPTVMLDEKDPVPDRVTPPSPRPRSLDQVSY